MRGKTLQHRQDDDKKLGRRGRLNSRRLAGLDRGFNVS